MGDVANGRSPLTAYLNTSLKPLAFAVHHVKFISLSIVIGWPMQSALNKINVSLKEEHIISLEQLLSTLFSYSLLIEQNILKSFLSHSLLTFTSGLPTTLFIRKVIEFSLLVSKLSLVVRTNYQTDSDLKIKKCIILCFCRVSLG